MTRSMLLRLAAATALAVTAAPTNGLADNPPSQKDLDAAKKAFQEGKKLHAEKKLLEAITKFKQSYDLSKNPLLLYNIALTMEEAQQDDLALIYFRKFLTDAPADAAQRGPATERVKMLEKKLGTGGGGTPTGGGERPAPTGGREPTNVTIKPAGTYSEKDFQHQLVDLAPPGKPLDVTAFVPEDSGFAVTLHYRTTGEGTFTSKPMKWRYKELVGRIPAPKMIGSTVQYYLEVKDQAGNVVTRSGKSTSPNTIELQAGAAPRFYPDITDDGDARTTDAEVRGRDVDEDDPLNARKGTSTASTEDETAVPGFDVQPQEPGKGFSDVGSSKFKYAKWGTTGVAAVGVGLGVAFYVMAGKQAAALEADSVVCGAPPCRPFDSYDQDLQAAGKQYQTISNVGIAVGAGMTVVAAYFWYKELTAKKRGELKVSGGAASPEASAGWLFAPSVTEGYTGAAASVRF